MKKIITKRGFSLFIICTCFISAVPAQTLLDANTHPKFVNPLPIPSILDGRNGGTFTVAISEFSQWLGLVDPVTNLPMNTKVWGYNGTYPGPTFLAMKDVPIEVFWRNNLVDNFGQPLPHFLPVDTSLHWALEHDPDCLINGLRQALRAKAMDLLRAMLSLIFIKMIRKQLLSGITIMHWVLRV
jgi:hypothetical protein